jgi:prepilin-type N-terminal cleavage/methylation domain-containing protein/prepilin-type processing-associated H-X9-DG protein
MEQHMASNNQRKNLRKASRGFSLLELLVVIAIIALLIAMLLPAMQRARQQAQLVNCMAILHSIGQAASIHVNEHDGCLPTGGWQWNCVDDVCDPAGLDDSDKRRYDYYNDDSVQRPLPITAALARYMGESVRIDSRESLSSDLNSPMIRRLFHCPSQEVDLTGWSERGDSDGSWTAPDEYSSYVFNEAMIGRPPAPGTDRAPRGKLVKCAHPWQVFFAMDGRPRDRDNDLWLMVFAWGGNDTVADFDRQIQTSVQGKELLDYWRHRMRTNALFLDFHVETFAMSPAGLQHIGVSKGINN